MFTRQSAKKRAENPDWSKRKVVRAVEDAGTNLRQLGLAHGYGERTIYQVFVRPYPMMEALIAKVVGSKPHEIWPSRYENGVPKTQKRTTTTVIFPQFVKRGNDQSRGVESP